MSHIRKRGSIFFFQPLCAKENKRTTERMGSDHKAKTKSLMEGEREWVIDPKVWQERTFKTEYSNRIGDTGAPPPPPLPLPITTSLMIHVHVNSQLSAGWKLLTLARTDGPALTIYTPPNTHTFSPCVCVCVRMCVCVCVCVKTYQLQTLCTKRYVLQTRISPTRSPPALYPSHQKSSSPPFTRKKCCSTRPLVSQV